MESGEGVGDDDDDDDDDDDVLSDWFGLDCVEHETCLRCVGVGER